MTKKLNKIDCLADNEGRSERERGDYGDVHLCEKDGRVKYLGITYDREPEVKSFLSVNG